MIFGKGGLIYNCNLKGKRLFTSIQHNEKKDNRGYTTTFYSNGLCWIFQP